MPGDKVDYREVAEYYDNVYHHASCNHAAGYKYTGLIKRLKPGLEDSLLDIACGRGDWLGFVKPFAAAIIGTDISYTAIKAASSKLESDRLCISLGEQLPFADGCFDIITCLGSLEHFLHQEQGLSEMARVARPGARIVILVPNSGFMTYRLGLYKGTQQIRIRETIRSIEEWTSMFERSGLQVTEMWADLHVVNRSWITMRGWKHAPLRALQAMMLLIWPLSWQYQIYFLCKVRQ